VTDFDKIFEGLDYPGKRQPLLRQQPAPSRPDVAAWDAHPRTYKVKGVDTEFFTIQHVALAVNRLARTIRHWEKTGKIPPATFRAPKPYNGSAVKEIGDRLYTRGQVEAIVAAATQYGVLSGSAPTPAFTAQVTRAWLQLQTKPHTPHPTSQT
jgi:hypothetical protein